MAERMNLSERRRNTQPVMKLVEDRAAYEIQRQVESLAYDYNQIPEEHRQQVQQAAVEIHRWQRDTIDVGKTLLAVKEVLGHGQFEDWWQTEFGLSERIVQSLLTVARVYGDPANPRRVAGLSDGALYLLAAPSTPEAARGEVEAMLVAGQTPTRAQVRNVVRKYLPPKPPKQLSAPEPEPDPEPQTIDAEYTIVQDNSELLFLSLTRDTVKQLRIAVLGGRPLREIMTSAELDRFFITIQKAIEGSNG